MVTRVLDIVRLAAISFESVGLVGLAAYLSFGGEAMKSFGGALVADGGAVELVFGIPAAMLVYSATTAKAVLRPSEKAGRVLACWPRLHLLEARIYFGLGIGFLAAVVSAVSWLFATKMSANLLGAMMATSLYESVVVSVSFYLADNRINRIFDAVPEPEEKE